MGVYIKGMEMPTDCHACPLGFGGGCYCGTSRDEYMCPDHGRAEWCPLVPVQEHGRLIDADALEALFWDGQCYFTENIKYKIKNIETIVPAEEGET